MQTQTASVQALVSELRECNERDFRNIQSIRRILQEVPVDPESLQPYLL